MTVISTARNNVYTEQPEHDDVMVRATWFGPNGDGMLRPFHLPYQPVSDYQSLVDWAVSMADVMEHPIYVVPLNHSDMLNTKRWEPFAAFIASMNDQERGEMRQICIATAASVMRDCDDHSIRAQMFNVLRQLKVIRHES